MFCSCKQDSTQEKGRRGGDSLTPAIVFAGNSLVCDSRKMSSEISALYLGGFCFKFLWEMREVNKCLDTAQSQHICRGEIPLLVNYFWAEAVL